MATLTPKKQQLPEQDRLQANVYRLVELALDKKVKDLKAYNVTGLTLTADALVVCTATSEPQAKAVMNAAKEGMREIGIRARHTEGSFHDAWMLIDFGDILFHVFREQARDFYDLDGLWADAPEFPVDSETS